MEGLAFVIWRLFTELLFYIFGLFIMKGEAM